MSYSVVRKLPGIDPDAYVCGRGTIYSPDRFPPSACGERFCDARGMSPGEVAPSIALIDEWCVGGHDDTEEAVAGGIKGAGATMGAEEEAAGTTEEAAEGHLEFVPDNLEILELAITWQI